MNEDERRAQDKTDWRRRLESNRDHNKEEIEDWFKGQGAIVVGGILVALALWFIADIYMTGL